MRTRLPSKRGAIEQPNATHEGEARLTLKVWLLIVATGIATGCLGGLLMWLLYATEHLAFGFNSGTFESGAEHASPARRILALSVAGVVAGVGWFLLRRYVRGGSEVDEALWAGDGTLSFRRSLGNSVLSEAVVGMGASLGREAAPKLMGSASASLFARWAGLSSAQRRLVVACGGGAGFAAVYNVPLGGALFTAEVLCGTLSLPVMLPAMACSWIATLTGWAFLPSRATYLGVPTYPFRASELVGALVAGPLLGIVSVGLVRLIGWVSHHRPRGRKAILAPLAAFLPLGAVGIIYPQLFGNGKGIASGAYLGHSELALLVTLALLKPLVTAACLGSGASGGLFTPVMSTGAALGGTLGIIWSLLWPGAPAGAYAMIGAAALVGAATQAPLSAVTLILELTHSGFQIMVPIMTATVLATATARWIDGYSIYSARLPFSGSPANTEADETSGLR